MNLAPAMQTPSWLRALVLATIAMALGPVPTDTHAGSFDATRPDAGRPDAASAQVVLRAILQLSPASSGGPR